jgi:hypothetical protein
MTRQGPAWNGTPGGGTASSRAFLALGAAAFADGPAADAYPARDNLDAMHEPAGDPIGNPASLQ